MSVQISPFYMDTVTDVQLRALECRSLVGTSPNISLDVSPRTVGRFSTGPDKILASWGIQGVTQILSRSCEIRV